MKQWDAPTLAESMASTSVGYPSRPAADVGNVAAVVPNALNLAGVVCGVDWRTDERDARGLVGNRILPGIGGMIGGALGSLFGGKGDQKPNRTETTLQAIGRNTRETITAIAVQTDLLLNPSRNVYEPSE